MIKRQAKRVLEKVVTQAHAVLGIERRKTNGKAYRNYLDHVFETQKISQDRELVISIITLSHRMIYDFYKTNGLEAMIKMIMDDSKAKPE